jgi:N-methylhydantoinase A
VNVCDEGVAVANRAVKLRVGIDVGGTFTDLAAVDGRGTRIALKTPSTPRAPEEGVFDALTALFGRFETPPEIELLAHSTTIATNALLGQESLELPRVLFLTTDGFRDVVEIGRQNRSEIYNLFVTRPRPLAARSDRIGVRERVGARGEVLVPLKAAEIERVLAVIAERAPDAIAIGFLHSYANDAHERRMGEAVRETFPDLPVTLSSQVDPEYREYERFSTTLVNAALLPIVQRYLDRLRQALEARGISAPLFVMQSNGGMILSGHAARVPAALVESGPASGVVAAAELARQIGADRVLSFDMGGTTAKAGTIAGGVVQVVNEFEAAGTTHGGRSVRGSGYPVRFPFVDLAEISAGGGTIAWIDEARALRVGPLSAGAEPGPACYGRGERATVTDANVVLGRLNQHALLGGSFPIAAERSRDAVGALARQVGLPVEETAAGIVQIVDAQMAKVLRIVTVERGLDPRTFSMVAFGGNGALHGCALAAELGITRVLVPEDPGVFSARGLIVAPLRVSLVRSLLFEAEDANGRALEKIFSALDREARAALRDQGAHPESISLLHELDARYRGQSFEITVDRASSPAAAAEHFHRKHAERYGYAVAGEPVEFVAARLTGTAALPAQLPPRRAEPGMGDGSETSRPLWLEDRFVQTPVFRRECLGRAVRGPALIEQYDACTYVPPGWEAASGGGMLVLEHT